MDISILTNILGCPNCIFYNSMSCWYCFQCFYSFIYCELYRTRIYNPPRSEIKLFQIIMLIFQTPVKWPK
jgi:hypothetical protein